MEARKPIRVGIVIIGSLLWDRKREEWRARLKMSEKELVWAPIRYGRLSTGEDRKNKYTMTFCYSCYSEGTGTGTAYVVPARQEVSNLDQLYDEANALGVAEGFFKKEDLRFGAPVLGAKWKGFGAIGLWLRNPNDQQQEIADVLAAWPAFFARRLAASKAALSGYPSSERLPLTDAGFMNLTWPIGVQSGRPVEFDLLLATPNTPNLERGQHYAEPKAIAEAYRRSGSPRYFIDNAVHGIHTAEDPEIWKNMLAVPDVVFQPGA